jgi:cytochrome c5
LGLLVTVCATLVACGDAAEPSTRPSEEAVAKTDASIHKKSDAAVGKADAAAGSKDGGKAGSTGTGKSGASGLPCDVKAVLDAHCTSCHAAGTPQFGAPMSLASPADFAATAPRAKTPIYEAASDRIQRTGPGVMPPSPQKPLSDEERATLLAWLDEKAKGSDETCATTADSDKPGSDAGTSAPEGADCELSFELRAHDGAGGKFPIPAEDDHYECFYFNAADSGIDATTLATSLSPLLDDTRVLHHWLLFAAENEAEAPSGSHAKCSGIHPGAFLMASWLPGTPALVLPNDVGMEFPKSKTAQLILENHYNNQPRFKAASDNSGVKVCATRQKKAQHAAIHWLGSELITLQPGQKGSAAATCVPQSQKPIHILGVIPHMHRLGRHVNMTIQRADGTSEVLHDGAFEFESQGYFAKQAVLQPGDKVHTQCDYMNDTTGTVTLGEKTTNEMCYMFTLAYPIGSMNTGGDFVNPSTGQPYVQGPNRCMK